MRDWKGNIIKIGDTVAVYTFKSFFSGTEVSEYETSVDRKVTKNSTHIIKDEYVWELDMRCEMIEGDSIILGNGIDPVGLEKMPLLTFELLSGINTDFQAVCIVGKSDNRDEFMINYFKA